MKFWVSFWTIKTKKISAYGLPQILCILAPNTLMYVVKKVPNESLIGGLLPKLATVKKS